MSPLGEGDGKREGRNCEERVQGMVGRDPVRGTVGKVIQWGGLWKRSGGRTVGNRSSEVDCGKQIRWGGLWKDPVRGTWEEIQWPVVRTVWEKRSVRGLWEEIQWGDCGKIRAGLWERDQWGGLWERCLWADCGKIDLVKGLWENRPGEGDCGKSDPVGVEASEWLRSWKQISVLTLFALSCFRLLAVSFVSDCFEAENKKTARWD